MSFIPALDIPVTCDKKIRTIAVPGLERDMIAYIPTEAPLINKYVDFVNVCQSLVT